MKKISIITLHSVQNYGSALQTYASSVYFENAGFDAEIVDFVRENNLKENLIDTGIRNSGFWGRNGLTRCIFRLLKGQELLKRYDLFDSFLKKYIKLTPHRYLTDSDFEKYPIEADIYCTGSDQTWNSYWNRGILRPFFLSYAKTGARKISYAASFGKNALDEEEKKEIKELLSDYASITVREREAVDILSEMGLAANRILDPTLMLTGSEWRSFATAAVIEGEYMLIYQLSHNSDFDKCARKIARRKGIKLVRIGFGNEAYFYGGQVIKNPGVREFLSLLANARYIITDSFHATSFAVNLNVEFFSWLPKAFSGRITDFLQTVGLSERVFSSLEDLEVLYDSRIDFASVNRRLQEERSKSEEIIKQMIK